MKKLSLNYLFYPFLSEALCGVIRAFSDFKAFLFIYFDWRPIKIYKKGFKVREGSDYVWGSYNDITKIFPGTILMLLILMCFLLERTQKSSKETSPEL